jgi:hypothetical protein
MARSKAPQGAAQTADTSPQDQTPETTQAPPTAPQAKPGLLIVTEGYTLFWPIAGLPRRGEAGTVVREDDPFLLGGGGFPDQRYKLRKARPEEEHLPLTPCGNRIVAEIMRDRGMDWLPLTDALIPAPPKPAPAPEETRDFEVPDIDPLNEDLEP